jgi:hypothetical protein
MGQVVLTSILLVLLITVPAVSQAPSGNQAINQQASSSSTSIAPCAVALCSQTAPSVTGFNPKNIAHYFGEDLGPVSWQTALTGFTWNVTKTDYLKMEPPSVGPTALSNSLVYYNSTETVWQMQTGANVVDIYFKPSQYSAEIFIHASLASAQSVCIPFVAPTIITQVSGPVSPANSTIVKMPEVKAGNELFSWSDISASYLPTWNVNKLCISLPLGLTTIDPLALDGQGYSGGFNGTPETASLTTTSSPDVIIALLKCEPNSCAFSSMSDVAGLMWHSREAGYYDSNNHNIYEYCAIASSTLTGDTVTVNWSGNNYGVILVFGISGANTNGCSGGNSYDSNGALPSVNKNADAKVSTSNAKDFIFGSGYFSSSGITQGAGFTIFTGTNGNFASFEYQIVSTTQTNLDVTWSAIPQGALSDAVQQSAVVVTQPIQITTAEGAPSATVGIFGCAVSNSTFTGDGYTHTYSSVTASCSITLSVFTPGITTSRYEFNVSPKPTAAQSITFKTCAGPGTCSLYQNTTYWTLQNTYELCPYNPAEWDGTYSADYTETYLGTSGLSFVQSAYLPEYGTSSSTPCNVGYTTFSDYNQAVTWGGYNNIALTTTVGNTWSPSPSGSNVITPTTGGNTYTINYVQSRGGGSTVYSLDWLLAVPVAALFPIVIIARKR